MKNATQWIIIALSVAYVQFGNAQNVKDKSEDKMKIEIWSDVMCPFCYIGKRHLEAALEQFPDKDRVEIEWKSFQLNPEIPMQIDNPQSVYEYLAEAKGISYEQSVKMHEHVEQMASNAGLDYHFEKAVVANSFNAHRVMQMAKTKGLGDKAEECFFRSYFTEGKDISDTNTLMALGNEIGLTNAEVEESLRNDEYAYRVNQDVAESRQIGVRGVPFFVFDRKYAVSGAQPVETFLSTLEQSVAEWKKENNIPELKVQEGDGPVCKPDEKCK
ncbi:MAG: DsbA family oxidoreductase [Flavobacteriales bacterium]